MKSDSQDPSLRFGVTEPIEHGSLSLRAKREIFILTRRRGILHQARGISCACEQRDLKSYRAVSFIRRLRKCSQIFPFFLCENLRNPWMKTGCGMARTAKAQRNAGAPLSGVLDEGATVAAPYLNNLCAPRPFAV